MEWEAFARTISPGAKMEALALRDHAEDILRATAHDMRSAQTAAQRSDKSRGHAHGSDQSLRLNGASEVHAAGRVESGFDLMQVLAEYRALRASVIRLWRESEPNPDLHDLDDLTRFNESIDQSVATAVRSYTARVERSRQMFLAILGHDLRNPLNSMMMSAELLSHETAQVGADSSETAAQIKTSAAAMGRMIGDLLDFTGAALGGAMPLTRAAIDLNGLCHEVVEEMRAGNPPCTLRFEPRGDLTGEWDASRLRQVISNLIGNAIQHGAAHCDVGLSVNGDGADVVVLAVHNQGSPIPPELLPTIFDPLVRGVSPELQRRRRPGSIGLGLYIAREVVHAHDGTIDAKSSATEGTVFTVSLPRRGRAS